MVNKETKELIEKEIDENLEESELEEEIERLEEIETNIDKNKFRDFMININPNSASLEQVAIAKKNSADLETGLTEAPIIKDDEDGIKYNAINYDEKKDKSYAEKQTHDSEDFVVSSSGSLARQNLRETIQSNQNQDFQINPELQGMKKMQDEYTVKSPTGEFKESKTQDPFQKLKKDYEFR